jgi:xanthine dehydrogenase large subunit
VDRGQVIGGFVQGMGWVTGECLVYDEHGRLLSDSPTTYKIPAASDVPAAFHCELFPNDDNVENVARSKAVGEPPLMLALSVYHALRDAVASLAPAGRPVVLTAPATPEAVLRAVQAARRR